MTVSDLVRGSHYAGECLEILFGLPRPKRGHHIGDRMRAVGALSTEPAGIQARLYAQSEDFCGERVCPALGHC